MSKQAPEPSVQVTLTLGQAQALNRALDTYVRIGIGQFETILELMRFDEITPAAERVVIDVALLEKVEEYLKQLKSLMGHYRGASLGIGSPKATASVRRAYEIKKVVAKALAEHRDPSPSLRGVDYDGLLVRYTQDEAPQAVVVSAPSLPSEGA